MKVYHNSKVFSIKYITKGGVNLYEKLKELLCKTNKTAYQISKETGISQTAFSNWKSGRSDPSIESLKKLAAYFEVTVDYFLSKKEE